jgi:type IV secretion system protein VirB8
MSRATDNAPTPARYSPENAGWGQDRLAKAERSRKLAWTVAAVAAGVVVLQSVALLVLIPLKQAVPYTVTVDRQTGYVQTTPGLTLPKIAEADAVKQAFLTQYVLARETFDVADYRENYRRTLFWSDGGAEVTYAKDWDAKNPNGIQARYRQTTKVGVTVKQITMLSPTSAIVRFETEQSEGSNGGGMRQPWTATIIFRTAQKPLAEGDRYTNPLGFQVVEYRRDAEIAAPVPAPYQPLATPLPGPEPLPMPEGASAAGVASGAAESAASGVSVVVEGASR